MKDSYLEGRRLELVLVIGFAAVGAIILAVGVILSIYGSIVRSDLVIFGFLFMFAAYVLGVEFGFIEKWWEGIYSGP